MIKKETKYLLLEIDLVLNLFFFIKKKGFIIYSTEIKPILKIIKKFEVNFDELIQYIAEGKYFDTSKTFFKNIEIFPPASFREFFLDNSDKVKTKKYWKLKKNKKLKCKNEDHFFKNFIKHASNAIKLNLVSDAKYSLLLSSGLDSNFIKSIIEDNLNKKITSFTYGWKNKYYDEILKIKKIEIASLWKNKKIYKRS